MDQYTSNSNNTWVIISIIVLCIIISCCYLMYRNNNYGYGYEQFMACSSPRSASNQHQPMLRQGYMLPRV